MILLQWRVVRFCDCIFGFLIKKTMFFLIFIDKIIDKYINLNII